MNGRDHMHPASDDLCAVIGLFAQRLCITYLSPDILYSFWLAEVHTVEFIFNMDSSDAMLLHS